MGRYGLKFEKVPNAVERVSVEQVEQVVRARRGEGGERREAAERAPELRKEGSRR